MITLLGKYRSSSPFSMDGEGLVPAATLFLSFICMWLPVWPSSLRIPPSAVVDVPEYSTRELTVTLGKRAKRVQKTNGTVPPPRQVPFSRVACETTTHG
jgi:hypothetical protein